MNSIQIPVGISNFERIRENNYYYIDKSGLLIDMLKEEMDQVMLITRPRRFGKTLGMSMFSSFVDIRKDSGKLFKGLKIAEHKDICQNWMNKYPTLFLSFKDVDGMNFENAFALLKFGISLFCDEHSYLESSDLVTDTQKKIFHRLREQTATITDVQSSLLILMNMMKRYYGKPVVLLIDEYDVPLDKAFQHGYYQEMVVLLRGLFGQALKTNEFLQFAVLTGCLRVSKESIFTGLNNFKVLSIADVRFDEQFGFTDQEVQKLLKDYDLEEHFSEAKEWYDGYHFGNSDIYCPWDVINYTEHLQYDPEAEPEAFWINSSGNDLVKRFVDKSDQTTKDEIEQLIEGNIIEKKIRLDLTYDEIDQSIDNLWSVLFTTGYLTQEGRAERGNYRLKIPNKEVKEVFIDQIQQWFEESVTKDEDRMSKFYQSLDEGDAQEVQNQLTRILGQTISILDTKARNEGKENFYHGMMLGLLRNHRSWIVKSNVESGDGFADIIIKPEDPDKGMIIELKYSKTFAGLEKACEDAIEQIQDRRYDEILREEGRDHILAYGIAFCKKRCKIVLQKI